MTVPDDKGFRFPSEMISHAVWLSFRFSLSSRADEELLAKRGIVITSETVRQWCLKFRQTCATELLRRPRCGDTWHLDEVMLTIRGKRHSLWRAVDQQGLHTFLLLTYQESLSYPLVECLEESTIAQQELSSFLSALKPPA